MDRRGGRALKRRANAVSSSPRRRRDLAGLLHALAAHATRLCGCSDTSPGPIPSAKCVDSKWLLIPATAATAATGRSTSSAANPVLTAGGARS